MESKFKKRLAAAGLILAVIGMATIKVFTIGDYYRSGLSVHFLIIGFLVVFITHMLIKHTKVKGLMPKL